MAARGRVADGVLGFAAVASEGMGRIAYVIYDRVRSIATEAATPEGELLGFVMAHEIGHLLLPRGPQPSAGLMKDCWTDIRRTIENEAAAGGSIADDARRVAPRDKGAVAHDRRENARQSRRATPGHGVVSGCAAHRSR
jgi:hypothetical protein